MLLRMPFVAHELSDRVPEAQVTSIVAAETVRGAKQGRLVLLVAASSPLLNGMLWALLTRNNARPQSLTKCRVASLTVPRTHPDMSARHRAVCH